MRHGVGVGVGAGVGVGCKRVVRELVWALHRLAAMARCFHFLVVVLMVLLVCAASARDAHATGDGPAFGPSGGSAGAAVGVLVALELIIPDVRFEVSLRDTGHPSWTLAWPIAFWAGARNLGKKRFVTLQPFVEGQYQLRSDALRVLAGARSVLGSHKRTAGIANNAFAFEYGAVLGSDGNGVVLGLGPVVYYGRSAQLGLILRTIATNKGKRVDLTFDLQVPL